MSYLSEILARVAVGELGAGVGAEAETFADAEAPLDSESSKKAS